MLVSELTSPKTSRSATPETSKSFRRSSDDSSRRCDAKMSNVEVNDRSRQILAELQHQVWPSCVGR